MWINIGTRKEEKKVWVEWFTKKKFKVEQINGPATIGDSQQLNDFLYQQLQNKAKSDLKKSSNPEQDAKTWKPTFGRKTKSKVEKLAEQIGKLSNEDQKELKGLL
jgi:hypothetical protein